MTTDEFKKKLEPHKRTAYIPVVQEKEAVFSAASKLGGSPFLRNEEDWPVCPNCKRHMTFFMQLNLAILPTATQKGLLQFFTCTSWDEPNCQLDLENYFHFSKGTVLRIIHPDGESKTVEANVLDSFPEKIITDWTPKDDYPSTEEYIDLGIVSSFNEDPVEIYDELYEQGYWALGGEKLFGWPNWVQGAEYPKDRDTGELMKLLFQIGSKDNIPYMWGDVGTGHISQSPSNPNELAWGWACS
jgi:uncharacterized protein YwqG